LKYLLDKDVNWTLIFQAKLNNSEQLTFLWWQIIQGASSESWYHATV